MSRHRPATRRPAAPPSDRRHRTPVKVTVQAGPRIPLWLWGVVAAVLVAGVVAVVAYAMNSNGSSSTPAALAPVNAKADGATIDGIECSSSEQTLFHIHAHVAIMVNGTAQGIPAGVGIVPAGQNTASGGNGCLYWLHTHTGDGIIHIESPVQRTFTLGELFDIWGQPLSATQVGPAHGTVIAYLNGTRYSGDPRSIPLNAHALVQLDVGADTAPQPFDFPQGL